VKETSEKEIGPDLRLRWRMDALVISLPQKVILPALGFSRPVSA